MNASLFFFSFKKRSHPISTNHNLLRFKCHKFASICPNLFLASGIITRAESSSGALQLKNPDSTLVFASHFKQLPLGATRGYKSAKFICRCISEEELHHQQPASPSEGDVTGAPIDGQAPLRILTGLFVCRRVSDQNSTCPVTFPASAPGSRRKRKRRPRQRQVWFIHEAPA